MEFPQHSTAVRVCVLCSALLCSAGSLVCLSSQVDHSSFSGPGGGRRKGGIKEEGGEGGGGGGGVKKQHGQSSKCEGGGGGEAGRAAALCKLWEGLHSLHPPPSLSRNLSLLVTVFFFLPSAPLLFKDNK